MRTVSKSIVVAVLAGLVLSASAPLAGGAAAMAAPTPSGTLTLTNTSPAPGDPLTFAFTTDQPDTKNWVAVYNDPSTAPTDEKSHGASTDWAYVNSATPAGSGTVTVSSAGLTPGHDVVAYLLHADGYGWLAQPITFRVGYATTGSLTLTSTAPKVGGDLTFSYTTGKDNAAGKDWVAVYDDPKKSPVDQKNPGSGSTVWSYVTGTSGSVTIPAGALTAGHDVIAYLLYDDGYTWLAQPLTFRLAAASSGPTADGTLTLLTTDPTAGQPLQFAFTTSTSNALNWIGVYDDPKTAPSGGKSNGGSTTWAYVPNATSGTVTIPAGALTGGHTVAAVLLYDDGYVNLAPVITFALKAQPPLAGAVEPTTDHFIADDILRPALRPSAPVDFSVTGLWAGVAGAAPAVATFAKLTGPEWLSVAADGMISGTAPATAPVQTTLLTLTATEADGLIGTLTVELPLDEPGAVPVVHAATLNMWDGGSHVANAVEKTVRSVLVDRFDLVALQSTAGQATAVARLLGWNVVEDPSGLAVLAPYPLAALPMPAAQDQATPIPALAVDATVGTVDLHVWNAALDATGADPATVCTTGAPAAIAAEKAEPRYRQATALAAAAKATDPLLLLGDFASPSSLDWTAAASSANCDAGPVAWPVTAALTDAGLVDAFRVSHPDPVADPGATIGILGGTSSVADVRPAALDRRDGVYVGGDLAVQDANLVVDGFPVADPSTGNRWVSDHAAVEATISLAAPTNGGGNGGGNGAGGDPGAGHPDPGTAAGAAGLPGALARTGDIVGLIAAGLAAASVVIGSIAILIRRRRSLAVVAAIEQKEQDS